MKTVHSFLALTLLALTGSVAHAAIELVPYDCGPLQSDGHTLDGAPHYNLTCTISAGGVDAGSSSTCDIAETRLTVPEAKSSNYTITLEAKQSDYSVPGATDLSVDFRSNEQYATIASGNAEEKCHKHSFNITAPKQVFVTPSSVGGGQQ